MALLSKKLYKLSGEDGVEGSFLSAADRDLLEETIAALSATSDAKPAGGESAAVASATCLSDESFGLLLRIFDAKPEAHMSTLFLLRIMVLQTAPGDLLTNGGVAGLV